MLPNNSIQVVSSIVQSEIFLCCSKWLEASIECRTQKGSSRFFELCYFIIIIFIVICLCLDFRVQGDSKKRFNIFERKKSFLFSTNPCDYMNE